MAEQRQQGGSFNMVIGLVMLVGAVLALWFVFKSVLSILTYIAPVLLIITLILNKDVVFDYVSGMFSRLKNDTIMGLAQLGGTIFFFPFVSAYLFGKAMLYRKVDKIKAQIEKEEQGEFVEYEELDNDVLELKDVPKPKAEPQSNDYDEMFNE